MSHKGSTRYGEKEISFIAVSAVFAAAVTAVAVASTGVSAAVEPSSLQKGTTVSAQQTVSYIDQRYNSDTNFRTVLGAAVDSEKGDGSLRYRDYQNGRAYWTPQTGVHEVHGMINSKFKDVGAHVVAGAPTIDETQTPDGVGRYNHFVNLSTKVEASIYWSNPTGAQYIQGAIRDKWASLGWERGVLGYPTTSEATAADGASKYNNFQKGTIYSSSQYGAQAVLGRIYNKWGDHRYDAGFLGKPITSEIVTPDGVGRYNVFQGGSIYWSSRTDAHSVGGAIRDRYAQLGWERSYLGYPTSDEYSINGGKRSNFQNGFITWNASTGRVNDYRY